MPAYSARDLATWSGGTWRPSEPSDIIGVSNDTRTLEPGNLYVALRGPTHDGHDFVAQAFARNAAAAVVTRAFADAHPALGPLLCVDDTLRALGRIASGYRRSLRAEMIAVTGSVGKTTVKEMIGDVLGTRAHAARSRGNWNNEIGLPLSLLGMDAADHYGVFELGMNHPGELAPLCDVLKPSWAVITNVGPVHIEFFDSVEAIAYEKSVVFQSLPQDGVAVASRDEPYFNVLRAAAPGRIVTTSLARESDYQARVLPSGNARFTVLEKATGESQEFEVPLPGEHVIRDALFAVAVGRGHGVPWDAIRTALRKYVPLPMRWNRLALHGVEIIDDAYNANPMSMRAALEAFVHTPVRGRRWLVLGGMLELGARSKPEHLALGGEIAKGKWAGLVAVGPLGALIADGAEAGDSELGRIFRCSDPAEVARVLEQHVAAGDAVLLKASRAERLERVLEAWRKDL